VADIFFKQNSKMPHIIIDCPEKLLDQQKPAFVLSEIHNTVSETGLFKVTDIKVRINPYRFYLTAGAEKDFIHVIAHIMEGRTPEQKKNLTERIVRKLSALFPQVEVVSADVKDIQKETYTRLAIG
jgi:5-carboxymethyl-2-hydroxymuconate isomerase